jgi:hypothetical protein
MKRGRKSLGDNLKRLELKLEAKDYERIPKVKATWVRKLILRELDAIEQDAMERR